MAYEKFNPVVPDGVTQTGPEITPSIRLNQNALGDAVLIGSMVDWDMAITVGPVETPGQIVYTNIEDSNQMVRMDLTWNVDDNPSTVTCYRSYDGGTVYELIGMKTIAWSAEGAVLSISWS